MADQGTEVEIVVRGGHPDFLDLPWSTPLALWDHERLVPMAHGVSRHVVRFVRYDHRVYALKETDAVHAEAEHRTLRQLHELGLPVVEPVGFVRARGPDDVAALITRYLDFSLPYWYVLGREAPAPREVLIDAAVVLLVRLHLAGVFWGDASLSNILFRRDAGAMMAYMVDAETTELRPSISDQIRAHDLDIAYENVVGGLLDLQASGRVRPEVDPMAIADELRDRYEELWEELTRTDRFDCAERWRIDDRLRRINELGFDVEELAIRSVADGQHPRHHPGPGRGGPPRPGAPAPHRPPGPGEPGPPAAGRHRELPGPARAGRGPAGPGRRGGRPVAGRGLRADHRGRPGRPGQPAGGGRALPRDARPPSRAWPSGRAGRSATPRRWPTTWPRSCPSGPSEQRLLE